MKTFLPAALLIALPLLAAPLSGCATPAPSTDAAAQGAPAPSVVQTALPPVVTGPINGLYQGASQQVEAKIPACPYAAKGIIEIGDRTLLFPYTYELIYVAPVQADGTVHATVGATTLDGHLIDGQLSFNVTTPECTSSFDFRRQGGF